MRYKVLSPVYIYYLGVAVHFIAVIFLAFLYEKSITSNEHEAGLILGTLSILVFFWLLFRIKKFIFAKIDLSTNTLLFGNLFFKNEAPLREVSCVGKYLYFNRILKLKIKGKTYYLHCLEDGVADFFRGHG